MRIIFFSIAVLCSVAACKKQNHFTDHPDNSTSGFITYTIKQGLHFSDQNVYQPVETGELKFEVRFDSSAVYKTQVKENQFDINKLFGFSDNNTHHHQFSARFGWRWSDGALRLYAYVYNNGSRESKEIGTVAIGTLIRCSIKATGSSYTFTMNDNVVKMNRAATSAHVKGYKLYPYFGGDEVAPHDIRIRIKEIY